MLIIFASGQQPSPIFNLYLWFTNYKLEVPTLPSNHGLFVKVAHKIADGRDVEGKVCGKGNTASVFWEPFLSSTLPAPPSVHELRSSLNPILVGFFGVFITWASCFNHWLWWLTQSVVPFSSLEVRGSGDGMLPSSNTVGSPGNQPLSLGNI